MQVTEGFNRGTSFCVLWGVCMGFDSLLLEMGFIPGQVVEAILTTVSGGGESNAAPMGVWVKGGEADMPGMRVVLMLRPFADTRTARNLSEIGDAVINLTWDPRIFFYTAFKGLDAVVEEGGGGTYGGGAAMYRPTYEPSRRVKAPRLGGMLGYVEVETERAEWEGEDGDEGVPGRLCFLCRVRLVEAPLRRPVAYSRARFAAIECVIHATRVQALRRSNPEEARRLTALIQEYNKLVERTAPGSEYRHITQATLRLASRWIEGGG